MESHDLASLELLADVDALLADLQKWSDHAPDWPPARICQALVRRLTERTQSLRVRLDAPLVVATLGGTGSGKSSLVNALVGEEVTQTGRIRPTTLDPVMICRSDVSPAMIGLDPSLVRTVHRDIPGLNHLVIVDCPDPDTTEDESAAATNLARLRAILPHCDVLLVVSTQQKYLNARLAEELRGAAAGAHLVFIQTHADRDSDIRAHWRESLEAQGIEPRAMFFVDSLAALRAAQSGGDPPGEFAKLLDLLSHELAGSAGNRIRRANFLDLLAQTLDRCGVKIEEGMPQVQALKEAIAKKRQELGAKLAGHMQEELLNNRRVWESRLLGEIASRWGFSPFSMVLRTFQGLGGLVSGAALVRMRTPAQLAIWGVLEGGRRLRTKVLERKAEAWQETPNWAWTDAELGEARFKLDGYAYKAGVPRDALSAEVVQDEAAEAGREFVAMAGNELQQIISEQAQRRTGWFKRWFYEIMLLIVVAAILLRLGKNFFYDAWLAPELGLTDRVAPVLGFDFFLQALFWLLLWCSTLLWFFTLGLRRGLTDKVAQMARSWSQADSLKQLFAGLEQQVEAIEQFEAERQRLEGKVAQLRADLAEPIPMLGRRSARLEATAAALQPARGVNVGDRG
jgi:hypothetical protein